MGVIIRSGRGLLVAALVFAVPSTATAASDTFGFDDLTSGTQITGQYSLSGTGLNFDASGPPPTATTTTGTSSPPNAAVLASCPTVVAHPNGLATTSASLRRRQSIAVKVGAPQAGGPGGTGPLHWTLTGFDSTGTQLAQSSVDSSGPVTTPLSVAAPPGTDGLFRFKLEATGCYPGGAAAFDDLTLSQPGPPTFTTAPASGITTTTATVSGTVALDPGGNPATAAFVVTGPSGFSFTPKQTVPAGTGPTQLTAQLTGLTAGTKYSVALTGNNVYSFGSGNTVNFVTAPSPPPPAPPPPPACAPATSLTVASYSYAVCGVPDLDQVRAAVPGVGLPNNGVMFCVPTAAMNFLARLSADGFLKAPGASDWTNPTNYDAMSQAIAELGTDMKTDGQKGTYGDKAFSGLQKYISDHAVSGPKNFGGLLPGVSLVQQDFFLTAGQPTSVLAEDLATTAISGAYVETFYGFYTNVIDPATKKLAYVRFGGHGISLVAAKGVLGFGKASLWFNDPANPYNLPANPPSSVDTQSPYKSDNLLTDDQSVSLGYTDSKAVNHFNPAAVSSRITNIKNSSTAVGGISYFIDGGLTLAPEDIITALPRKIAIYSPLSLLPGVVQPQPVWAVPKGGPVEAIAHPRIGDEIPFIQRGARTVKQVNRLTGALSTFSRGIAGARALSFGSGSQLYVGGSQGIIALDRAGHQLASIHTPDAVDALTVDTRSGQIVALSARSRRLQVLTPELTMVAQRTLPATDLAGGGKPFVGIGANGALIVHRDGSKIIASARFAAAHTASSHRTKIPRLRVRRLKVKGKPHGFVIDDAGNQFVTLRGRLTELSPAGVPIKGSPFNGRPAGSLISVSRSSTNYKLLPGQPSIDYLPPAQQQADVFTPLAP